MSLTGNLETNALGGGGFGSALGFGGAGFGGIAPVGLIGLNSFGHHGHVHHAPKDDCAEKILLMNAIGNLKDTIGNAKDAIASNVQTSKDALESSIERSKDSLDNSIDRAKDFIGLKLGMLDDEICEVKTQVLQSKYDLAIKTTADTQSIKDQAAAFQIANDRKFDELSREGERNTAAILARMNEIEGDRRDDLIAELRRENDRKHNESTVTQLGIAFGNQIQAANSNVVAVQTQIGQLTNVIHGLASQVAKSGQDIINVGGLMAGVAQTANPVNVKS